MPMNDEIANLAGGSWASLWHALYTRHHHENVVAHALSAKGFEVFLPQYRAVHRWKDRQKELMLPLFPNYVFIRGGLDRMLNIVTTQGVHSLICWVGLPADSPLEEIEAVRRMVEGPLPVEPHPFLKSGNRVRIKSGPLEGMEGILVRKTLGFRLVLSVEMLSKSAAVEVDVNAVERVRGGEVDRTEKQGTVSGVYNPASHCSYVFGAG